MMWLLLIAGQADGIGEVPLAYARMNERMIRGDQGIGDNDDAT